MSVSTLPPSVQNPDPLSSALSVGAPYAQNTQGLIAQQQKSFNDMKTQQKAAEAESKPEIGRAHV